MNNSLNDKLSLYYKEIGESLICPKKQKDVFIKELKSDIGDYMENSPEADMDEIISVFGSPAEIADSFTAGISHSDINKKLRIRRIVIAALFAVLLIWGVFAVISFIDVHTEAHGYFSEEILNIYNVSGGEII